MGHRKPARHFPQQPRLLHARQLRGKSIEIVKSETSHVMVPAHAEMIAITQAAATLGTWRLLDCTLYVTLEPCVMCAGAMVNARLGRLVYAADDPKAGAAGSVYSLLDGAVLNHRVDVSRGDLATESGELLRSFFRARRQRRA